MPVYIYFIFVSILSGALVIFRKETPMYIRVFPFFLALTALVEIIGWQLSDNNANTTLLYNVFTTLEFIFYFWMLRQVIRQKVARRIILFFILLYPVVAGLDILRGLSAHRFHSETYALGCFLVAAICIFYFLELFVLPHSVSLVREPAFWICSGLLFFYSCSFPIFGYVNFLNRLPVVIQLNLGVILDLLNILLYSLFAISFLCRYKVRKSI